MTGAEFSTLSQAALLQMLTLPRLLNYRLGTLVPWYLHLPSKLVHVENTFVQFQRLSSPAVVVQSDWSIGVEESVASPSKRMACHE